MSTTTWYPYPRNKASWLLGNGEVVYEPELEQTTSGKKLRVVGTTTSAFRKDMDTMILAAVQATARAKNTYVWQPLTERTERMFDAGNIEPRVNTSDLYLLRPGTEASMKGPTKLWWTFQHPQFPEIEALLVVTANAVSYGTGHVVVVRLVMPDTRKTNLMETTPVVEEDEMMTNAWYYRLNGPEDHQARSHAVQNPTTWAKGIIGQTAWQTDRQVVQHLLRLVDRIDSLGTIQVQDLRDFDNVQWMDLEPSQSNYNGAFRTSLTDYLSGSTAVDLALQQYAELRETLRSLGIAMGDLNENDFQRALLEGEKSALRVTIGPVADEDDEEHGLGVHLATGTFTVVCSAREATRDEVAVEWERVQTIASLTGQEPALLAFAREYGRTKDETRARKVMRDRMKGARED